MLLGLRSPAADGNGAGGQGLFCNRLQNQTLVTTGLKFQLSQPNPGHQFQLALEGCQVIHL